MPLNKETKASEILSTWNGHYLVLLITELYSIETLLINLPTEYADWIPQTLKTVILRITLNLVLKLLTITLNRKW